MPNSKRRKRLVASNKKQIERARRRIEAQSHAQEADKENAPDSTPLVVGCKGSGLSSDSIEDELHRDTNQQERDVYEPAPGWLGGLYSWCHSGIAQVYILLPESLNTGTTLA